MLESEDKRDKQSQDQQYEHSKKDGSDSDEDAMKLFEESFIQDDLKKKKGKHLKIKKKELMKIKSQQKWKEWEQMFAKEQSEGDEEGEQQQQEYFTGMEFQKPDKNPVKRKNKMFDNE